MICKPWWLPALEKTEPAYSFTKLSCGCNSFNRIINSWVHILWLSLLVGWVDFDSKSANLSASFRLYPFYPAWIWKSFFISFGLNILLRIFKWKRRISPGIIHDTGHDGVTSRNTASKSPCTVLDIIAHAAPTSLFFCSVRCRWLSHHTCGRFNLWAFNNLWNTLRIISHIKYHIWEPFLKGRIVLKLFE